MLLVIRHLNTEGSGALPEMMVEYDEAGPFLDVTEDGFVSPADALTVISYLNGEKPSSDVAAEGESLTPAVNASDDARVLAPTTGERGTTGVLEEGASANDTDTVMKDSGDDISMTTPDSTVRLSDHQPGTPATRSERDSLPHTTPAKTLDPEQDLEDILTLIADDVETQWWKLRLALYEFFAGRTSSPPPCAWKILLDGAVAFHRW